MTSSSVIASEAKQSRDWEAPVIVVHSLAHAIAALKAAVRAGRPVVLASAPGAASYVGPGWFRELVAAAREAVPEAGCSSLLDCGDNRGATLAAIRSEVEGVVFTGRADVARHLADIASQHRVRFVTKRPVPALDLGDDFFAAPEILKRRCVKLLS
jgi:acyl-CoA reductase-like NAD-dependent aldehyde dehydrogenase